MGLAGCLQSSALTGKSRCPSVEQKNGNTASKLPLDSIKPDGTHSLLFTRSRKRQEISPSGSLGASVGDGDICE